jgi:hypothetical protein
VSDASVISVQSFIQIHTSKREETVAAAMAAAMADSKAPAAAMGSAMGLLEYLISRKC